MSCWPVLIKIFLTLYPTIGHIKTTTRPFSGLPYNVRHEIKIHFFFHILSFLVLNITHIYLLFFWCHSYNMRTLMITLPVDAAMPYPFFLFFSLLLTGIAFCPTNLVIQGVQNDNPTLDTIYSGINYWEWECYVQFCISWAPRNPPLWIPVPPVLMYYSEEKVLMNLSFSCPC